VAAHSFVVNGTGRSSFVYAAIENNGIFQMNLNTRKIKEVKLPVDKAVAQHIWKKGYRDVCIAAPVTADGEVGTSMLFLHYKKEIYALDASKCVSADCAMIRVTDYNHHEGFMKTMACAAHTYKSDAGHHYTMYLSQRGGTKVVMLDLTDALKVKGATVRDSVIATATGKSVDGAAPSFVKFQGIGIYAPRWTKPAAPFVMLSGGGDLRVLDFTKKYVHTLAHVENGAVAVLGDDAFSGSHRIFKTDLNYQVKCDVLNAHVLPELVKWKTKSNVEFAKERKSVELKMGAATGNWMFKVYKIQQTPSTAFWRKQWSVRGKPRKSHNISMSTAAC